MKIPHQARPQPRSQGFFLLMATNEKGKALGARLARPLFANYVMSGNYFSRVVIDRQMFSAILNT